MLATADTIEFDVHFPINAPDPENMRGYEEWLNWTILLSGVGPNEERLEFSLQLSNVEWSKETVASSGDIQLISVGRSQHRVMVIPKQFLHAFAGPQFVLKTSTLILRPNEGISPGKTPDVEISLRVRNTTQEKKELYKGPKKPGADETLYLYVSPELAKRLPKKAIESDGRVKVVYRGIRSPHGIIEALRLEKKLPKNIRFGIVLGDNAFPNSMNEEMLTNAPMTLVELPEGASRQDRNLLLAS